MNRNVEQTTSNQLLADGWRLTRGILALKGLQIPQTIEFRIDSATHIRATRTATLDELARAVTALDEAIERRSESKPSVTDLHSHLKIEDLNKRRDALVELQKANRPEWRSRIDDGDRSALPRHSRHEENVAGEGRDRAMARSPKRGRPQDRPGDR